MNEKYGKAAWDEYRFQLVDITKKEFPQYMQDWEIIGRPLQYVWMKVAEKVIQAYEKSSEEI